MASGQTRSSSKLWRARLNRLTGTKLVVLVQPAKRILLVVHRHRGLGQLERVLGVEHDRKFFSSLRVFARHDRTWMRSMRDSARMQGDRGRLNPLSRSEISADVEQDLVRFHIVMNPGDLHCFRVIIEHPRSECADHVAPDFESLMDRRRLMDRAGNRLEVPGVKGEWINVTVPTHDI